MSDARIASLRPLTTAELMAAVRSLLGDFRHRDWSPDDAAALGELAARIYEGYAQEKGETHA